MNKINKLFLFGFESFDSLDSLVPEFDFKICKEDFLIQKAIDQNFPILFFAEEYNVFSGEFIIDYLDDIKLLYPFSKFIFNYNSSSLSWSDELLIFEKFCKNNFDEAQKVLLARQAKKYNIGTVVDLKKFQSDDFMIFDQSLHANLDLKNFLFNNAVDKTPV